MPALRECVRRKPFVPKKASEESRRLDETQVFVFKIQVDSVTFDGAQLAKTRGLRFALALQKHSGKSHEDRILLTPSIKPIVEELESGEGRRQCFFSIRYEVDVLWEGDETLVLSAVEPGRLFFSTQVASCDLPLAVCYEQLVSSAKNCNPTEAEPLPIELELESSKGFSGRCRIFVHCWKESLKALGGRKALRSTFPESLPGGKEIHSEAIRHKMTEIHECHSLNEKLQKAQADLWLQGVKRLTDEGRQRTSQGCQQGAVLSKPWSVLAGRPGCDSPPHEHET
ncbi:unnamed protein product [Symbiodinium sp. CCMP2456]|nr:unnamed protein product [Symbiodinium sp. CCMP2456]